MKLSKVIITMLIICTYHSIQGQELFNNRYILDQTAIIFWDIFNVNDTIVTVGLGSTFYAPFPGKMMVTKFDRGGIKIMDEVILQDSFTNYSNRPNNASIRGRKVVVVGGGGGGLANRFGWYARYDLDAGLEWYRALEPIDDAQQVIYSSTIISSDHIILLKSELLPTQGGITSTVWEVNPQGETLWESSFGSGGVNHRPGRIVAFSDSTYLIGLEKYPSTGSGPNIHTFLIEIDNVGNVISTWDDQSTRTYAPRQMIPLEDGGLLYASRYLTIPSTSSPTGFPSFQGYLVRQDADRNILWTLKTGNPSLRTDLFNMIETMDGNYIAVGSNFDDTLDNGFGIRTGYLIKFDESGTVIWEKQYYGAFGGQHKNEFYDIVEMADSSLVLCGESTRQSEDFPQRGWLVSLDKNGNLDSLTVDVKMVETRSKVSLDLYPNPATDYVMVELSNENIERVELYSMTGQLLRSEVVSGRRVEVSVGDLPSGVYSVLVNGRYGKRVVIGF